MQVFFLLFTVLTIVAVALGDESLDTREGEDLTLKCRFNEQHSDKELAYGSPEWQWVPELVPAEGEPVIHKQFNSSFEQTTLEEELAELGSTYIALAGAATNWCVRATAYGALDRGYDLTLISDAHTTGTMDLDNGVRIEAANVIDELNIAMTWLSYPGRTNGIATAEEVDFVTPRGQPA